ncbi:MAG: nucleoside phosphorylase [Firmicutes bacterium]|nr:nucleoside phosphorylase [[Eubacterium] siraeum]MCM1487367.1 nucleoside phosphorylase [Bacillota bacterium]
MIVKNDFPVLEYSTEEKALLDPREAYDYENGQFPELCFMPFFAEVFEDYRQKYGGEVIGGYNSEMRDFPVIKINYKGKELCMMQAPVGSAGAASFSHYLYANGVKEIIACGGCGVLDQIPSGDVVIPTKALRDEGASYQYLAPSRTVDLSEKTVKKLESTLKRLKVPYIECTTWTTDGLFRETKEMIEYRRAEGCKTVEMECAAFAAAAKFMGRDFGQIFYSGDILIGGEEYDDRKWYDNMSAREKISHIAVEALCFG